MNIQDPIADMFTHIRNAQLVGKTVITMSLSKQKLKVAELLKNEGYIEDCGVDQEAEKPTLFIKLKYYNGQPVIESLKRVSRPGLRVYKKTNKIPRVKNGLGVAIVSTSKGIMADRYARHLKLGGEVIGYVS
ncbi:MAG: 30S ribosomal protein S8 [Proteobacteria bacterium]|nr:30S ribosomal protein S8 [Pseudomonadota bacterium]